MKIQTKIALCIILSLLVCSVTQFYINRKVVSSKIQDLTKRKLDEIAGTIVNVIEKERLSKKELEDLLNKKTVIGKTGFVFVIDTKGTMVIHKKVQGKNWIKKGFIKHIVDNKEGYHRYLSPKTGTFKVASFRFLKSKGWIVVASAFENEDLTGPLKEMERISSLIIIPLIAAMSLICILTLRFLVMKPLGEVVDNMKNIAEGEGDLSRRIRVKSNDELGMLGSSFNRFQIKLSDIIKEISEQSLMVDKASESMRNIAGKVSKGTDEISKRTNTISASTGDVNNRMNSVSASAQQSEMNISVIANGIKMLGSTIEEIKDRSFRAKSITDEAVTVSVETKKKITDLGNAAVEIGNFTGSITDISEQTNLLALNATIEAARAGDSGKGFAVVAGEIKALAGQTTDAAKNINQMIESIQFSTDSSVGTIEKISTIINDCNELVTSMASLVEEQSKTTGEITDNIMELLKGVSEVSSSVKSSVDFIGNVSEDLGIVNLSVSELAQSGKEMAHNSNNVADLAGHLRSLLGVFKT